MSSLVDHLSWESLIGFQCYESRDWLLRPCITVMEGMVAYALLSMQIDGQLKIEDKQNYRNLKKECI